MPPPTPLPKSRLEAITDGIFAVTMTLLVLDLKFADRVSDDPSRAFTDLLQLLPYIDDYVISFIVLCAFWLAHLRLISRMREADAKFAWLNLMFLLFTTFVPPLTSWIGHGGQAPAVVYGGNLMMIVIFEALMWRHACMHLMPGTPEETTALWRIVRKRFAFSAAVIAACILAALVEIEVASKVNVASYLYLLLIVAALVPKRHG